MKVLLLGIYKLDPLNVHERGWIAAPPSVQLSCDVARAVAGQDGVVDTSRRKHVPALTLHVW